MNKFLDAPKVPGTHPKTVTGKQGLTVDSLDARLQALLLEASMLHSCLNDSIDLQVDLTRRLHSHRISDCPDTPALPPMSCGMLAASTPAPTYPVGVTRALSPVLQGSSVAPQVFFPQGKVCICICEGLQGLTAVIR